MVSFPHRIHTTAAKRAKGSTTSKRLLTGRTLPVISHALHIVRPKSILFLSFYGDFIEFSL